MNNGTKRCCGERVGATLQKGCVETTGRIDRKRGTGSAKFPVCNGRGTDTQRGRVKQNSNVCLKKYIGFVKKKIVHYS